MSFEENLDLTVAVYFIFSYMLRTGLFLLSRYSFSFLGFVVDFKMSASGASFVIFAAAAQNIIRFYRASPHTTSELCLRRAEPCRIEYTLLTQMVVFVFVLFSGVFLVVLEAGVYLLALWNMFSGYEYLRVEKTKIPWLIERLAHDRQQVGPAPSRTVLYAKYTHMSGNTPAKLSRESVDC